jgi:hypothetical protein
MGSPKGRRIAIAMGTLAVVLAAVAGYLLRDDIWWRWRLRNFCRVEVHDPGKFSENITLREAGEIAWASTAARKFLGSLTPSSPDHGWIHSCGGAASSIVDFYDSKGDPFIFLAWFEGDREDGYLLCGPLGCFLCDQATWLGFLRELLRPVISGLIDRVKDPQGPSLGAALPLAYLEPRCEGVLEVLLKELKPDDQDWLLVLRALAAMGPQAERAVPEIRRFLSKGFPRDMWAARALGAIGPAAADTIPELEALVERSHHEITCNAARIALWKIGAPSR